MKATQVLMNEAMEIKAEMNRLSEVAPDHPELPELEQTYRNKMDAIDAIAQFEEIEELVIDTVPVEQATG